MAILHVSCAIETYLNKNLFCTGRTMAPSVVLRSRRTAWRHAPCSIRCEIKGKKKGHCSTDTGWQPLLNIGDNRQQGTSTGETWYSNPQHSFLTNWGCALHCLIIHAILNTLVNDKYINKYSENNTLLWYRSGACKVHTQSKKDDIRS